MKLVPQNINEAIKHLSAKTPDEIEISRENFIAELERMDPSEIVEEVKQELREIPRLRYIPDFEVAVKILANIDQKIIMQAVGDILQEAWDERTTEII